MTHATQLRFLAVAVFCVGWGMGISADDEPTPITSLNSPFRDNEASFTHDGHTVYFACHGRFSSAPAAADICVSHLTGTFENMQWSEPEPVPFPITTTDFNEQEPKISLDGKRLYFQSNRPGGKGGLDVWVSERGPSGEWQDPVSLPFPINTAFNDHCLYFDDMVHEDSAYLASNRPGTLGGNDLWYTVKIGGEWTAPVNLGPNINSPGNDHMAMVGPDGRLWVTSNRAGTMGGEDQWVSERDANGNWGPLRNLGAPWNSPSDDRCGDWTFKRGMGQMKRSDKAGGLGSEIYFVFASSRPEAPGAGNLDNYYVRFGAVLESLGLSRP
jgi:WD40 repeat protein